MATQVKMPQLGETVVEGTITRWLKREGESVGMDEPLVEVSTDKVDSEIPSPVSGTVSRIHAGEGETSRVLVNRPELVLMDRAGTQSGADLNRLDLPPGVMTGIGWYARFPEHYAGDARGANRELGEFDMKAWADQLANVIRAVKADQVSLRLQNEFFERAKHPLDTKQ